MWRVLTPAFLVMLAIGFGTTRLAEQAVESELEDRLDRLGDHAAKLISFRLDSIVENARGLSRNELLINGLIDTQSRGDYLPPFFNSLQIPGLKEATIRLTDYRGRTIVANRRDLDETHDPDWIEKVLNGQEYFTFTRDHLHIAVPVFYNGMPEGALSVKFKSSSIAKQFSIGWENSIALVNDEGIIVYSSNPDFVRHGMIAPGNTQVPKWIINRRLIPNQPALSLLSAIEESRAFSSLGRLRDSLSIVIIFNLAALAIAISFAAFLTTHALKGMIETIRQIGGAEDLNKTIETKGPAEMQELGQTFNTMIERLQKTTTSRDFVDSIINSMNEILIVTSMSGTIQTSNPAAKRFLRENKKSAVKTITETLSGNDDIDWDTIQPFLNDRTQDTKYESAYISNEESPKYILWSKSFLKKKNGRLDG
ncbi:MAG: HAMP domain-containing protein, partial [Rhodospirillales bacterium]|nr:HAMP domain-containing protein [Rhodospirillales bacterium]